MRHMCKLQQCRYVRGTVNAHMSAVTQCSHAVPREDAGSLAAILPADTVQHHTGRS